MLLSFNLVATFASVTPLLGKGGSAGGGELTSDDGVILPLTPEQQASIDRKMPQLAAMAAGVVPNCPIEGPVALNVTCPQPPPPSYTIATYARHQHRFFYCGPATVQVISNASWGYYYSSTNGEASSSNKFKQSTISSTWTFTDRDGQTLLGNLISGMNHATRLPWTGFYSQWSNPTWSEFHNAIKVDTWSYELGLAAHVNPRMKNSPFYLTSWKNVAGGDYGHYIPLRGYSGSAQSSAIAYYNDSSGGRDEVTEQGILGATGAFSDLSYTVYQTMKNRSGNLVW